MKFECVLELAEGEREVSLSNSISKPTMNIFCIVPLDEYNAFQKTFTISFISETKCCNYACLNLQTVFNKEVHERPKV